MADYRIVCVNTEYPHRHITRVGTGTATTRTKTWTVTDVRSALTNGDKFHTISPSTGKRAEVYKDTCNLKLANGTACDVKTIRSAADAVKDNNLDNLACCG